MAETVNPGDIEKRSLKLIAEELENRGIVLSDEYDFIVKRVIHTTADFDFVDTLCFSDGAVAAGLEALSGGATIVTDTNMALSGISKPGLKKLGANAVCYMADDDVAREAKRLSVTRASIAMKKAVREHSGADCIFSIGNAPTALMELSNQIESGFRPRLLIAVPVGFVNVIEAKEEAEAVCKRHDIPCIVAHGRKGGSTVSAAICNALIYRASS